MIEEGFIEKAILVMCVIVVMSLGIRSLAIPILRQIFLTKTQ